MKFEIILIFLLCFNYSASQEDEQAIFTIRQYLKKADIFREDFQNDSALYYSKQALIVAKENSYDSLIIKSILAICKIENDTNTVLGLLDQAEQTAKASKLINLVSKVYYRRAEFCYKTDKNGAAFNYFIKLDSLSQQHIVDPFESAMAKVRLAGLLFRAGNWNDSGHFPQIEKHLNEGLKLCDSFDLNRPTARLYLLKGVLNKFKKNYTEAIRYYNKALNISTQNEDYLAQGVIYNDIGSLYHYMNKIDSAEINYKKAIEVNKNHMDTLNLATMNIQLANFYNMISRPKDGLKHLLIAQDLYKNRTDVRKGEYFKINDVATNIYFNLGMLDSAFIRSKEANRLFVEMTKTKNEENIIELETKYETEKKEQQIALLKSQNQLVNEQKNNQRNLFLAGLLITSLIGVSFFLLYQNRQKTNDKLKELDELKTSLFTNISHELRTPLTLISGPIEKQMLNPNIPDDAKQELGLVQNNTKRLLTLIDQLTDLAKVDSGQIQLRVQQIDLYSLLSQQLAAFRFMVKEKGILLNYELTKTPSVWLDQDVLQKITSNLLSNAIKYAPNNTEIDINALIKDGYFQFSVTNKVNNLTSVNLDTLFERFYQEDSSESGMGVGLALVKELVALHKGSLNVKRARANKIVFEVKLCVERVEYSEDQIIQTEKTDSKIAEDLGVHEEGLDSEPSLLIVEDDPDVRTFIKSIFEETYHVLLAENGSEGIDKATQEVPDLIISDVMMPIVNGLELTQNLKSDMRTSHIPIILLTAKVGDKHELEGIESGADDYITKPFKPKLLETKVSKLIAIRKQLQARFSQEVILRPIDIALTSTEERFLGKLQDVLDEQLVEPYFNVNSLSQALGMSRMQLHRKLKAMTGLTTSEFIHSQRLKVAANLLLNSDIIVSQVGYAVGYNDHSYFTKSFKKQYGYTPSEYIQKNKPSL